MKFNNGDIIHGFRVTNLSHIQEVDSDAYLMQHERSGARLLYLANNDDNKVFFISFRTTPDNSKGTPHIMEHSTLCGSRKFPLKEPFVELAKGSLNTFLNAITWPDKRCTRSPAEMIRISITLWTFIWMPFSIRTALKILRSLCRKAGITNWIMWMRR